MQSTTASVLVDSGNPGHLVVKKNWQFGESREFTRSSRCGFVAQWLERATRIGKTLGSIPGGLRCVFSSEPAVSSSIFVGAERGDNPRNDPDKSEFMNIHVYPLAIQAPIVTGIRLESGTR